MIYKILLWFKPSIDIWIVKALISGGIAFLTAGLTGISWRVQLFLHIIEIESVKRLGQNYSIGTVDWVTVVAGASLILLGLLIYFLNKRLELKLKETPKLLIAIIHKSIDDFIKPDYKNIQEINIEEYQVQEIEIDQTMIYKNGNLEYPEVSLIYQNDILSKINALTNNYLEFEIAYFGLAHIPIVWELGSRLADKFKIDYYEYDRNAFKWKKMINSLFYNKDFFSVKNLRDNNESRNAIVKIEISYAIDDNQIFQVINDYNLFTTIKVNSLGLDKITDLNQIEDLTKCFRDVLDEIIKDSVIENIHIFYSGPVSLGLSLSRKISKRTDPVLYVYNYTRNTTPNYKWAVKISNTNPLIITNNV